MHALFHYYFTLATLLCNFLFVCWALVCLLWVIQMVWADQGRRQGAPYAKRRRNDDNKDKYTKKVNSNKKYICYCNSAPRALVYTHTWLLNNYCTKALNHWPIVTGIVRANHQHLTSFQSAAWADQIISLYPGPDFKMLAVFSFTFLSRAPCRNIVP